MKHKEVDEKASRENSSWVEGESKRFLKYFSMKYDETKGKMMAKLLTSRLPTFHLLFGLSDCIV
jgi:hypothetical protein